MGATKSFIEILEERIRKDLRQEIMGELEAERGRAKGPSSVDWRARADQMAAWALRNSAPTSARPRPAKSAYESRKPFAPRAAEAPAPVETRLPLDSALCTARARIHQAFGAKRSRSRAPNANSKACSVDWRCAITPTAIRRPKRRARSRASSKRMRRFSNRSKSRENRKNERARSRVLDQGSENRRGLAAASASMTACSPC